MNSIKQRTITGIILVAVIFSATFFSIHSFFIVFLLVCIFGVWELYELSLKHEEVNPLAFYGSIMAATLFSASFIYELTESPIGYFFLYVEIIVCFIIELYRNHAKALNNLAHTFIAVVYFAVPLSFLNFLLYNNGTFNTKIILGILLLIWMFDSSAYLVGSLIGNHKLFERISPNKSWEGFIGGSILTLLLAFFMNKFIPNLETIHWIVLAILIIVLGTFGDLSASLIKRSTDVKDYGSIFPGHGGILDRFDTMVLTIPAIFIYLKLVRVI